MIIDVRGHCPFTDYMVLGTARSQRLAGMMAGAVLHALKARASEVAPGKKPTIEGAKVGRALLGRRWQRGQLLGEPGVTRL